MNQLVFVEKNQAVTTSLIVADVFEKDHKNVLKDIRELGCSDEFRRLNFEQSIYINSQNKEMPMYHMNKKGFTLLAMGYTGKEAMKFKEAYIDQFEKMENELKGPRILTDREQLMASMQLTIEAAQEIAVMKEDVLGVKGEVQEVRSMVEHQITLDHGEQRRVQKAIAYKVYELENDQEIRSQRFRELHREIRDRFAVASYRDIKRKDILSVVKYIEAWVPRKIS